MQQAAIGMLFAVIGTLLNHDILDYQWIIVGLGSAPSSATRWHEGADDRDAATIAISHTFGAIAATLVGVAEYRDAARRRRARPHGGARLRGALRRADRHRHLHGVRQAAGTSPGGRSPSRDRTVNLTLIAVAFGSFATLIATRRTRRPST